MKAVITIIMAILFSLVIFDTTLYPIQSVEDSYSYTTGL